MGAQRLALGRFGWNAPMRETDFDFSISWVRFPLRWCETGGETGEGTNNLPRFCDIMPLCQARQSLPYDTRYCLEPHPQGGRTKSGVEHGGGKSGHHKQPYQLTA